MYFKQIILSAALLLTATLGMAQYTVSGTIKDSEFDDNLEGVSIYLPNKKVISFTDENGNFKIENLKTGNYILEIEYPGYESRSISLKVEKDEVLDIYLNPSVTELNEVVITGVSRATEMKKSPVIIKILDKDALNQTGATNLIDAIKSVPGVSQITTGAAISKPIIRGLGFNRVITLNNGIRQEGQQWGDEHGIEIDEFGVDRVEIIKGPGSLIYGSDGIAGVLNFLPPKALPDGKTKSGLLTNYQTNNHQVGYSFFNSGNFNGFQWLGRISNKLAGNYKNRYDGRVYNSGFKEFNANLFLGLNRNWGYTHLTLSSFNTRLGIVEGERDENGHFIFENEQGEEITASNSDLSGYSIGFPQQKIHHLSIASNSRFQLNQGVLNADFGFQSNRRKEFEDPDEPENPELYLNLNTFTYHLKFDFHKSNGWETSLGIGGMQQNNHNKGEEFLIPDYGLFDIGVFAVTQKSLGKLTLAGGLRMDSRHLNSKELYSEEEDELKFQAFKKNFGSLSGSIGLSYQPNSSSTLKFNFSRGFRAPNIAELASNGVHEGTFRYEIGNSDLKSEVSHQLDLAYSLNSEHITLEVSPFVNFIQNYIFIEKMTDENDDEIFPNPDDPVPGYKFTSGDAVLIGGEIYLDFHPHPWDWLHVENSFSYVRGTFGNHPENAKYLSSIPAPKYRGEIKAEIINKSKSFSNLFLKFGVEHSFAQNNIYSLYDTETSTPSYTLLNAGIGANFNLWNKNDKLTLYISGDNLTDTAYQDHLSRLKYAPENPKTGRMGVFNQGRNFSIKLMMNF